MVLLVSETHKKAGECSLRGNHLLLQLNKMPDKGSIRKAVSELKLHTCRYGHKPAGCAFF